MRSAKPYRSQLYLKLLGDRDKATVARSSLRQEVADMQDRRGSPKQIIVKGSCHTKESTFFVDTGSAVSLVSKSFTDFLDITKYAETSDILLKSFTSDSIKTYGKLCLEIEVAGYKVQHTFIITALVDTTCLLGLDFLNQHNINIDITRQVLSSDKGVSHFLQHPKLLKKNTTVKSTAAYLVPPNTVMYIKGKTTTDNSTYSGFLEPKLSMLESGLLIESGLCLTTNKQIPVKVINFSDHPVQVYKNKVLGKLYPIDNRCDDSYRSITISDDKPTGVINDIHVNK